jgi:metal-responsive CopG/Arc/MetJ family transcriptional regulator
VHNLRIPKTQELPMSVRFNLVLSDDLNTAIDREIAASETNKSEVMRKALQLYLAARDGNRRGLKIGLVEPATNLMHQEFIGL